MNNNIYKLGILFALSATAISSHAEQKAILIGIDGVQYQTMKDLKTPNFDRLMINKAYTGGIKGDSNEQATSSGPGWSTILTGVWANKHLVVSNGSGLANKDFPSIFKRITHAKPNLKQASIVHWSPIHTQYFANDIADIDVVKSGLSDKDVTSSAITEIKAGADFIFVHLDDPDEYGHSSGFGEAYNQSIITADAQLGEILDSVEAAEKSTSDDWLVIVTTDHGREANGHGHGGQSTSEKTIFIGSNKTLNKEFSTQATTNNNDFSGIYGYASQASITPTILTYLGIAVDGTWKLDGPSLLGDIGIRKLMRGESQTLSLVSDSDSQASIYKNDRLIDSVAAKQQQWQDSETSESGVIDYVINLNNNPVAYRDYSLDINAALNWSASRAYFFRGDSNYVRYNKTSDKADDGYPRQTTASNWPGLGQYQDKIVASFHKDAENAYFFLNDGNYIAYNMTTDKALAGYPKAVTATSWPGLEHYAKNIVAALRGTGDSVFFFLSDGQYIRYNIKANQMDDGYPKAVTSDTWPGLNGYAKDITSALQWNDSRAYIFLKGQRYIRYNIGNNHADDGYPTTTNNTTWPGLMTP